MGESRRARVYIAFAAVQAVGMVCSSLLVQTDLTIFLSVSTGFILLLPGSIAALFLAGAWPLSSQPAPQSMDMIRMFAVVLINCAVFAGVLRLDLRPFRGSRFQTWLWATGIGNILAVACIYFWWPSANLDMFKGFHVLLVAISTSLTVLTLAVLAASLIAKRWFQTAAWTAVVLQGLRLVPASRALNYLPGGDDGPGMGGD